jgi:4-diphosphocytidyl-2C-methyl-D-erythritol kinase
VVVDPGRPLATAAVFRRLDQRLTPRENANNIFRFVSSQLDGQGGDFPGLSNDLEAAALEEDPGLAVEGRDIRGILVREGAVFASLSGSGAAFFGVFSDAGGAQRARSALVARGFRAIRGRTLSLDRYRRMLSQPPPGPGHAGGSHQGRSGHHGDHGRQGHSRRG